jgi:hypothetical protein
MKAELDLELCKKLLGIFSDHNLDDCSDEDPSNTFAHKKGYILCTRCWLLNAAKTGVVPTGSTIEIYAVIDDPGAQNQETVTRIASTIRTKLKNNP